MSGRCWRTQHSAVFKLNIQILRKLRISLNFDIMQTVVIEGRPMEKQLGFGECEFNQKRRKTRKERFLAKMEELVPWDRVKAIIEPHYPKAGQGRHPYPLTTMLRIHLLQQGYSFSDPAMEDALYETTPLRQFAHLSLDKPIPDESTIMNFRHLLERHQLGEALFAELTGLLGDLGVLLKEGTLMDAAIIKAPSATKNRSRKRDPEMHQAKKGNQWHFGMKAHSGVDAASALTYSLATTSANAHDITQANKLLHGEESIAGLLNTVKA